MNKLRLIYDHKVATFDAKMFLVFNFMSFVHFFFSSRISLRLIMISSLNSFISWFLASSRSSYSLNFLIFSLRLS